MGSAVSDGEGAMLLVATMVSSPATASPSGDDAPPWRRISTPSMTTTRAIVAHRKPRWRTIEGMVTRRGRLFGEGAVPAGSAESAAGLSDGGEAEGTNAALAS